MKLFLPLNQLYEHQLPFWASALQPFEYHVLKTEAQ